MAALYFTEGALHLTEWGLYILQSVGYTFYRVGGFTFYWVWALHFTERGPLHFTDLGVMHFTGCGLYILQSWGSTFKTRGHTFFKVQILRKFSVYIL